ncbi:MAG: SURF1 family protein [Pseudomonadota bacterium]
MLTRFKPERKTTLLTACLLPLLVGLGFWQLDRQQQKLDILDVYQQRISAPPLDLQNQWPRLQGADESYRRVQFSAELQAQPVILLDNKVINGIVGYEVIQKAVLNAEQVAWVNRGWVAAGRTRQDLPVPDSPAGSIELQAHVYIPLGEQFILSNQPLSVSPETPIIAQQIDMAELQQLSQPLQSFPHLLRLEQGSRAALEIQWPAINTRPEKHQAYAIQWFAMAFALIVFYGLRSLESAPSGSEPCDK